MAELTSLTVRVLGDVTDLRSKMSKAEKSMEQFGYNMKRTGRQLTTFLTLPIAAAGAAATKMASDAVETANKFDIVMGPAAARLRDRFDELHSVIPATREEMERMAAGVQDLLVPLGIARDEAADMSLAMVELGADIASFNNVATTDVLEAFKSGLAGQSRPLRQFGINVLEERLKVIALEEGLLDASGAMDRTARAQAVLIAATRDSADAIGDAARTADQTAQSFKFFLRNVKELATTIGTQLLPVITPMVNRMNEALQAAGGLSSSTVQWAISIATVAAALGPLLFIGGNALQMFVALRVATAGLSVALGIGTGGLAWVIGGLIAGLGYLATAFVKSKLEAAAFAAETKSAAEMIRELDAEATGAALNRARQARDAANRRAAAAKFDVENPGMTGVAPERLKAAFETARNEAIALQGQVTRLEKQLAGLQSVGGAGAGSEGGVLGGAVNIAGMEIGRVLDRVESLRGRLSDLRSDHAFADTAEEAKKLREEIEATERSLNRAVSAAQRIATAGLSGVTPRTGIADSGAFGVGRESREFADARAEVEFTGGFDAARVAELAGEGGEGGGAMAVVTQAFSQLGPAALALGAIFEIIKGAMEPLQPVLDALKQPLQVVGKLLGETLAPILESVLVPIIVFTAKAFSVVMQAIGWFIEAIGWVVDKLLGWLTDWGEKLMAFGQDMQDNAETARREIDAREGVTESLQASSRILNAPQGFKAALARFNATNASGTTVVTGGGGGGGGGGGTGGPTTQATFTGPIMIQASATGDTPEGLWQKFKQGAQRAAESGDADAIALGIA